MILNAVLTITLSRLWVVDLLTKFSEYGTQRDHRQEDTWSFLGLAFFVGEEVTVHNTGISLLLSTSALVLLSPPIEC